MEISGPTSVARSLNILLDLKSTLSSSLWTMSAERQFGLLRGTSPRRLAGAMFALAFFSQLFVPCWISASPERATPRCCQAHGKHRCAVATGSANSTGQDAKRGYSLCSSPEKCPFRNLLVPHSVGKFAVTHSRSWVSEAAEPSRLPEVLFGFATAGFSSHTDRGPPLPEN
jgi:hypothetical protein